MRSMRSEFPEMYILYVSNTQDETYINTALEDIDKDLILITTIEKL